MEWAEHVLIWAVLLLVPLVLIGVPVFVITGAHKRIGLKSLQRCFNGIDLHDKPQLGDVIASYHTYRGLLLWTIQEEHRLIGCRTDVEALLGRLLRFNLIWGLLSYGMLFIPFLALGNYHSQLSSIRRQQETTGE